MQNYLTRSNGSGAVSRDSWIDVPKRFPPALEQLLISLECAQSTGRDVWDFAVEIDRLRVCGLTETDFRWLTCMEYVDHARETTTLEHDGRQFVPTGDLSFSKRTCIVLTEHGASFARRVLNAKAEAKTEGDCNGFELHLQQSNLPERDATRTVPIWNAQRHELKCFGTLIKRFKWPAVNQETILSVFDEENWPNRIDDPLPPNAEMDTKNRLHDTIKSLNKGQKTKLVRFRGDGTGEGVLWEFVRKIASR